VSAVKYELGFYIPEDDILRSDCRENLKSCTATHSFNKVYRSVSVKETVYREVRSVLQIGAVAAVSLRPDCSVSHSTLLG
jgi:hypothetical protein